MLTFLLVSANLCFALLSLYCRVPLQPLRVGAGGLSFKRTWTTPEWVVVVVVVVVVQFAHPIS